MPDIDKLKTTESKIKTNLKDMLTKTDVSKMDEHEFLELVKLHKELDEAIKYAEQLT